MAETVGQHSVAAFTSPVNGTSPIDANTVKGNDNTIRSAYVDHDADPGIHVQSSTLASRPVANSAGRKWMTQDSGVIRLFYDDGTSWYEVDYLRTTGGTISGNLAITGTLAVTGVATFTAQPILSSLTASRAVFTDGSKGLVSNAITGTGDVVMSASPTLTGTITAASATLSGTLGVSGLLTFASLKGTGATTVTNILDEDNMASDSATALATQQSIKAYVDAQVGASDALSEVLAIGNTTGANDIIVSAGQKIRTPAVAAQDGSSAITIANTTGALTLATALADSNLATISTAGKVSNSATTATSANTASAIVARDASGNFTAGTITAALTGNASTATTLQTARNINGVSFNGSADITVTAAAGTLTGTTLASNVTASSLTSVGTLANLTVTNPITGSVTGSSGSTTGNAATATALQTARNINGVSFNGTADITVTAAAGTLTGTTLASGVTASSLTSVGTLSSLAVTGDLTVDTSTLKVDSTNNRVGIGTATPGAGYRLHIVDSGNTVGTNTPLFLSSANGVATTSYGWDNLTSSYDYTFKVNGSTTAMTISNTGNLAVDTNTLYVDATNNRVGVGTATPTQALNVNGITLIEGSAQGNLIIQKTGTNGFSLFSNAAGTLGFYDQSAGATRMAFDSSGNLAVDTNTLYVDAANNRVGVGTASPSSALTIVGETKGIEPTVGTTSYYLGMSTTGVYLGTASAKPIYFETGGTERMRLDASGNLAVGTTSPPSSGTRLTVNAANQVTDSFGLAFVSSTDSQAANLGGQISLGGVVTGTTQTVFGAIAGRKESSTSGEYKGYLQFSTINSTVQERMRIDSNGNLGLGVTPSAWSASFKALQVSGLGALWGSSTGFFMSNNTYNDGSNKYIGNGLATRYYQSTGQHIWENAPNNTSGAGAAATLTQAMTLDASGNLGVGTTAGSAKLNVQGEILASSGTVGTSGATIQLSGDATASNGGLIAVSYFGGGSYGPLKFATGGNERARITSGGFFKASNTGTYAGSTGAYHELRTDASDPAYIWNSNGTPNGIYVNFNAAAPDNNTQYFLLCNDQTTPRCYIWSDGDLANHDGVYGTISDERLKQDIVDAPSQWDDLKAVRFRKYRMKTDVAADPNAPFMLGVVAQELELVSPGLVDEHPNEDGTTTKTVKSSILLMKAAVALQEAMARIESLEARLAALESK